MNIYQEELMDHYRHPRHKGRIERADFDTGQFNPSCGDAVAIQGIVQDGLLTQVAFEGKGCVISQATTSMVCAYALNKPIAELAMLTAEHILALIKIPLGPTRLRCALLPLQALQDGLKQYQKGVKGDAASC